MLTINTAAGVQRAAAGSWITVNNIECRRIVFSPSSREVCPAWWRSWRWLTMGWLWPNQLSVIESYCVILPSVGNPIKHFWCVPCVMTGTRMSCCVSWTNPPSPCCGLATHSGSPYTSCQWPLKVTELFHQLPCIYENRPNGYTGLRLHLTTFRILNNMLLVLYVIL